LERQGGDFDFSSRKGGPPAHIFPHGHLEQVVEVEEKFLEGRERDQQITRIILDLISGMTERHALIMHRRLTGISLGSALDMIEGR